jgi:5-methylcytosine-specific restriction enzyme subunit McrC
MTKDKSILINNIYHMLSYAFQALNQETYEDVAVESFDEMYNLLAAILSKGIGLQLKQGLYREYISRQEELSVMRGKINMPGTIKNRLAHKRVLTCDFDELSENNLLNQILKTTVTLLLRNGKVQAKYKDDLKKKMLYFSNVEIIEPTGIKWSSIRFQRNNQTYRMLVSICQLIIEGMLITTDSGDYRLASFVDEQRMCRLYEKFILEYYSRHYPELSVSHWMMVLEPCFRSCKAIFTCSVEIPYLLLMRNTIATLRRSSLINILFIQITCIRFSPM